MFLRSLTLKGFKSFAEATTLEFEPGLTVVVGPNGSGKSNVVDAVAWVLGAQGPRTVRSARMEDVIFSGSGQRPALGRAEVTLTIDNSAGLLPIDLSEVTVTRTLFRSSGEGEYALNGVPCRLLDVQELLSDTGVGRQQHVIVSQGQIDAVLESRPEDRRLIIEEAAGILKFRRRKEKAQRRLESTEANMQRLADLHREVRRQLRPLERQAEAARSHDRVAAELRAVRLFLSGREFASLSARHEAAVKARASLETEEAGARASLGRLDNSISSAESWLSKVSDSGLDDAVSRLEALRERARGLAAVLVERRRSLDRERAALVDESVVASLESDGARLSGELAEVDAEAGQLAPELARLAEGQRELAQAQAAIESSAVDDDKGQATLFGGRAAEVRGEINALRSVTDRARVDKARVSNELVALAARLDAVETEIEAARATLESGSVAVAGLRVAAQEGDGERAAAEAEFVAAAAVARDAIAEQREWAARAEGLAQAADPDGNQTAQLLADVPGVVGTLLDLVEAERGWEGAVEAALSEAVRAVVVDGVDAARHALAALAGERESATLLALGEPAPIEAGFAAPASGMPGQPVRAHVRAKVAGMNSALDGLLGNAIVVDGGWSKALDASLAFPRAVVVTVDGDRFSAGIWRVGSSRVIDTRAAWSEAQRRSDEAATVTAAAESALGAAEAALAEATRQQDEHARALAESERRMAVAAATLASQEAEGTDLRATVESMRARSGELVERLEHDDARLAELEAILPDLEADEAIGAQAAAAAADQRRRVLERAESLAGLRTQLEVRAAGLDERRRVLSRQLLDVEERLARSGSERADAESRRRKLDDIKAVTARLAGVVDGRCNDIEVRVTEARVRRQRHAEVMRAGSSRLETLRRQRAVDERHLEELRERFRRAELDQAEGKMRLEAATEGVRRDLDCEPDVAVASECPPLPDGTRAETRARELDRELRLMGPINPLALEELAALQERDEFLQAQLDDVRSSRRELSRVIKAVDCEIVQLLAAAYADVADNFTRLFETLFPGGQGRLRLTDPDNVLETGVEIEARPAGKTVRRLSLLSGGERSMCALAFLFAVFRSRPSPFYLLDEVEAALDDVNLHRFLDLLKEFREEAQLLVVTHQKRTMEAAECLYGVTMQPGGSSRVISQRVSANT
ncbi:MAG TPA: chromosome segregation protein SMC [Acidimicrobiales bacterium]|nr:chromosome segregation protein SMC [Acidimicrobiales bacterium]